MKTYLMRFVKSLIMKKNKGKYAPKLTNEEYKAETGQNIGQLKGQSRAIINGVERPTNG